MDNHKLRKLLFTAKVLFEHEKITTDEYDQILEIVEKGVYENDFKLINLQYNKLLALKLSE